MERKKNTFEALAAVFYHYSSGANVPKPVIFPSREPWHNL